LAGNISSFVVVFYFLAGNILFFYGSFVVFILAGNIQSFFFLELPHLYKKRPHYRNIETGEFFLADFSFLFLEMPYLLMISD
jgi:hypothetical protein